MNKTPLLCGRHVPLPLPCCPTTGTGSRGSSSSGMSRQQCSTMLQSYLRLVHALLRRDYAVGYVMLSWLLRCTWAVTPAIAMMLGLPHPASSARAMRHQVPAMLAWLLRDAGSQGNSAEQQQRQQQLLLEQLQMSDSLKQLHEELLGPTAAVTSYANFARACQMLAGAPVTAEQVGGLPCCIAVQGGPGTGG